MNTYFISRHPGTFEWAARQIMPVGQHIAHFDQVIVKEGDTVIGSLPINLAAQVCVKGVGYWHLSLKLPAELRGFESNAEDMQRLGAHARHFEIKPMPKLGKLDKNTAPTGNEL